MTILEVLIWYTCNLPGHKRVPRRPEASRLPLVHCPSGTRPATHSTSFGSLCKGSAGWSNQATRYSCQCWSVDVQSSKANSKLVLTMMPKFRVWPLIIIFWKSESLICFNLNFAHISELFSCWVSLDGGLNQGLSEIGSKYHHSPNLARLGSLENHKKNHA